MSECIFCKIVEGSIPAAQVFSTENIFCFLDIAPVNKGHCLVITKRHYPTIWDIPTDLAGEMLLAIQSVGEALIKTTKADGLNVGMNNHEAAGQLVPHAHWHLIPRFTDDGLSLWPGSSYKDHGEMEKLATEIQNNIS